MLIVSCRAYGAGEESRLADDSAEAFVNYVNLLLFAILSVWYWLPVALFWSRRHGRISGCKWRHARVPFPPDHVVTYCQKFNLPIDNYQSKTHHPWQPDAAKAGLEGTFAFITLVWASLRSQMLQGQHMKKK